MNAPLLVVNGDDGGLHPATDDALISCASCGILRSVSVIANGVGTPDFITRARDAGIALGLHFNLSEGAPVGGPYDTLTGDDGLFLSPKIRAWDEASRFDPDEVAAEAKAQFHLLVELGCRPGHVDGHNHIQVFAPVLEGLIRALGSHDLAFRIPHEPEADQAECPCLPAAALPPSSMRRLLTNTSWRVPERFVGFAFTCRPGPEGIGHLAKPAPTTEWMVHPGCRPGSEFMSDDGRRLETEFLCSASFAEQLESWGYRLGSFEDMS